MKKFLLFFLSFIFILNFSFSSLIYAGLDSDSDMNYSSESDSNLEGGGDEKDNYKNTFWYGKVEDIDGKFGISI